MRITVDIPDEISRLINKNANEKEFGNRSAVVKKALTFYLFKKPSKGKRFKGVEVVEKEAGLPAGQ